MSNRPPRPLLNESPPKTPIRATSFSSSKWSPISMNSASTGTNSNSTSFWRTPPKPRVPGWSVVTTTWSAFPDWGFPDLRNWSLGAWLNGVVGGLRWLRCGIPTRKTSLLVLITFLVVFFWSLPSNDRQIASTESVISYQPLRPVLLPAQKHEPDPVRWLKENSGDRHAVGQGVIEKLGVKEVWRGRPRAALISLVRNSELEGILGSMRQLEYRWNGKYQYPWIFFNDEPFTDEFKGATQNITSAKCFYEVVPREHWSLPDWIDEDRFMNSLEYLGSIGVGKGWLVSYHHMCRWNSGFFYKQPILKDYDWYWRVEPDVHYFCDIDYDIFRFMRDNKLKYGFNMAILDDARSFPSLWTRTLSFAQANPHLIHPNADLSWLRDLENGGEYNNCQFFSNFEIGDLSFWRGEANEEYFRYLDKTGGFYYERFGDAPVHTLAVGMFLEKRETWWFRDVGYQHGINRHCPPRKETRRNTAGESKEGNYAEGVVMGRGRCDCEQTGLDEGFYKLVPLESPQKKPSDTCLRLWLGGEWLTKKEGWTAEGERAFGGDGYGGYVLKGDE